MIRICGKEFNGGWMCILDAGHYGPHSAGCSDTEMPMRTGWVWAALAGVMCWVVIISVVMIVSCGPSTQTISTMNGAELYTAHRKEIGVWGQANMDIVRALRARGAITDADVRYYADGHWVQIHDYNWEALGYASEFDLAMATDNKGATIGTTVYTGSGMINVRRAGHAVIVRRAGR